MLDRGRMGRWVSSRRSAYTQTTDWRIHGLSEIVETRNPTLLETRWNAVVAADGPKAFATYQANRCARRYVPDPRRVNRWALALPHRASRCRRTPRRVDRAGRQRPRMSPDSRSGDFYDADVPTM